MSIYCTRLLMADDCPDDLPSPIAYLGSHVRIEPDPRRHGHLSTAHIPPWCAYGVEPVDVDEAGPPLPYLRLSMDGYNGREPRREASATVVLDRAQVKALRDDLDEWLSSLPSEETESRG
ncbi:hypothetical protein ACFFV7_16180 [Nonomuraea spiralis]|uniref:Uncharacterized protein n=1 Tax=Nonomuraea spiralis TaxID=46182 RepID=A0ABV5IDY6_9ACTN|nr:hypothetical protein [Nonomuraea spiralis]GGS67943.1 hypothetical protein GCM10010176_007890 [Nonomuraea spiralis]